MGISTMTPAPPDAAATMPRGRSPASSARRTDGVAEGRRAVAQVEDRCRQMAGGVVDLAHAGQAGDALRGLGRADRRPRRRCPAWRRVGKRRPVGIELQTPAHRDRTLRPILAALPASAVRRVAKGVGRQGAGGRRRAAVRRAPGRPRRRPGPPGGRARCPTGWRPKAAARRLGHRDGREQVRGHDGLCRGCQEGGQRGCCRRNRTWVGETRSTVRPRQAPRGTVRRSRGAEGCGW